MRTVLPIGSYVDAAGRPVVVLVRPDQLVDYSQVQGIVLPDGTVYPVTE